MADQPYYSVFTKKGLELLTEAIRNGTKLGITHMAFGDGGGSLPVPNENFTKLVNEVHRTQLNSLSPDPNNANWLRAEAIIASATGGFNIRELGLYAGDVLVAYSNYPATYKPNPSDGTARIMTFRMVLQIDNTASFELKIDADIVMATIASVDAAKLELYQNTVGNVEDLASLKDMDVFNHRVVNVSFRETQKSNYFAGKFIYLENAVLAEDGGTIFTSNRGKGRWVRLYTGDVQALWFGIPNGKTDQNILNSAIQCAIDNGKAVDLSGSTWGITSEVRMHTSITVKSTSANRITAYEGNYKNSYAVEVGDPAQGWLGGRSTIIQEGMFWIDCASRDYKLHGVYIKGSFNAINTIRAVGFNGVGIRLDAFHDSQVNRLSVELCGNETDYAFTCTSTDDTCNAFSVESLQVEQSYQRGIYITETIRSTIHNIHSERLITTNKDPVTTNPLGYDLNHVINIGNCTINQAIFDSTDTDQYMRLDGFLCNYDNFYVDEGHVYGEFGDTTTYSNLLAKSFSQLGILKDITFINPKIPTMLLSYNTTVHQPEVTDMNFGYHAENINIFGGSIVNYGASNTSDVAYGNINAHGTVIQNFYKTGNASGYQNSLMNCKIENFFGNWDNPVNVIGGIINNASIVNRALPVFDGVTFDSFNAVGEMGYITRNCKASGNGTINWSVPNRILTAGVLTERIGYSTEGKLYQSNGKEFTKLF
ncbi:phage tail protein [Acinetobacter sp. B5B]|uniref:phage tail protein n=1 Tax=Acinetobacter baretiae TaxID=2605383 RepID=UPI0018C2CDD6|nr:phage tail protein [Acinetobacter baretiae]MBF7683857.1 phage tail protein [Acinetobacter baretiae]